MFVKLTKIPSVVRLQGPSRRRKTFRGLKGLRCVLVDYSKSQGDWAQVDLQGIRRCLVLKRLWYSLVELPEIPSVV